MNDASTISKTYTSNFTRWRYVVAIFYISSKSIRKKEKAKKERKKERKKGKQRMAGRTKEWIKESMNWRIKMHGKKEQLIECKI